MPYFFYYCLTSCVRLDETQSKRIEGSHNSSQKFIDSNIWQCKLIKSSFTLISSRGFSPFLPFLQSTTVTSPKRHLPLTTQATLSSCNLDRPSTVCPTIFLLEEDFVSERNYSVTCSENSNRPAQDDWDERLSAMELHSGKREAL